MTRARTVQHGPERQPQSRVSDHTWRCLVENLPDTVTLIDADGTVLLENRRMYPRSREGDLGRSVYSQLPDACRQHVRDSVAAAFRTGQPQYCEIEETDPEGSTTWYAHRIVPVWRDNTVGSAMIITSDISRYRRESAAARRELDQGESRRLASIAELAAGVGHEINNPLAVVQGYAEVLLDSNLPEEALSQIQNIHAAAKRAARIVRDLNHLAAHAEPMKLPVNLKALMGQAIDLKKQEFIARNIKYTTDFPQDLPGVLADPYQLMEAILNILTNAQQAVAVGGAGGAVHCQARVLGRRVRLSISDNGPGIPPENISRIFDPFFTTHTTGNGPGLGLSISYAIVHQNGGELWAESVPGAGSTFHIQLPVHLPD